MGFSYRRSRKFGPLRLSASRRGLGASVGGKRVRVGRSATGRKSVSVGLPFGFRWLRRLG